LTAGQTLIIQVGGYNNAQGPATLNILPYVDPCSGFVDDSFEENDDCSSANPLADGLYTGLGVLGTDKDHYSFSVADGATVDVTIAFATATADLDLFLWDATDPNCGTGFGSTDLANGFSTTDNEFVTWTNTTGACVNVVAEVNVWVGSPGQCNTYDFEVLGSGCGPVTVGTPVCSPMDMNSTGQSTSMTGTFGSGVGSGLHLEVTNGVPGEFGYFLIGTGANDPGIVLSNGRLCLAITGGNQFGRYNFGTATNSIGQFGPAGVMQNLVGTATSSGGTGFDVPTQNPISGQPAIAAGSTWHFQLWHRDTPAGAGTSNFSNALSVMF